MTTINIEATKGTTNDKATQLPQPQGYRILCMVPKVEGTYGESGLIKADDTVRTEELTTVVLFVAKLGPDAYKDRVKFPSGPWCKEGDFIITRTYAGTRLRIFDTEWRLINDDSVEAVVDDPRGIRRAG